MAKVWEALKGSEGIVRSGLMAEDWWSAIKRCAKTVRDRWDRCRWLCASLFITDKASLGKIFRVEVVVVKSTTRRKHCLNAPSEQCLLSWLAALQPLSTTGNLWLGALPCKRPLVWLRLWSTWSGSVPCLGKVQLLPTPGRTGLGVDKAIRRCAFFGKCPIIVQLDQWRRRKEERKTKEDIETEGSLISRNVTWFKLQWTVQ